ncbi:nitroreductase [Aeromicrobium sp. SORGH_AS981]|uniref:nitroreductase n=1 Tax=Aeromicrobium sp. SORGH_AS_0981 TaxID=3041802 RepID=UPI002854A268|nr:nitroreductase [Aeromicrobium sp. SORGH_AS_0981]MDR6117728.1 nitroreductase [Aeromicrobium sp. SORGH_AS_0981]
MSAPIDVLEGLLADRWSCRGYTDEQVDTATIERLLAAAQRTPSWCNTQPWHVVVTAGGETERLKQAMADDERFGPDLEFPPSYEGVYAERRRESGWQLYEAVGVVKGDRAGSAAQTMRNFEFFGAPHVAIVTTTRSLGVYGAVDCGLYVQSFLLAAQALGLGACAQAALAMRSELLREWFELDDDRQVVCGISFGHPDPDHPTASYRTTRAPLDQAADLRL